MGKILNKKDINEIEVLDASSSVKKYIKAFCLDENGSLILSKIDLHDLKALKSIDRYKEYEREMESGGLPYSTRPGPYVEKKFKMTYQEWLKKTEKKEKQMGISVTPELYAEYEEFVAEHNRLDNERAMKENGWVCGRPIMHIPAPSFASWMMMKKEREEFLKGIEDKSFSASADKGNDCGVSIKRPAILGNNIDIKIAIARLKNKTR